MYSKCVCMHDCIYVYKHDYMYMYSYVLESVLEDD